MVDSMDTYKSLNINIGTVMENPEMLELVPDHLKTKQRCNYAVKKLLELPVLKNGGMLEPVPNRDKTQEVCNIAVDNYVHA